MSTTTTKIIDNCSFFWAKLDKPVNPFGSGDAWELQIRTDDVMVAEDWQMKSLNVKSKEEDGKMVYYVNLKRWAKSPSTGKTYEPPKVLDGAKEPVDPSIVGNGSKGKVKVYQYEWSKGARKGITSIMVAVQVLDLVEYKPEASVDFDVEDPDCAF